MIFGNFEIHCLDEGQFTIGLDKVFVPYEAGEVLPKGTLFVAIKPFLIKSDHDILLLDCGLGEEAKGRSIMYLMDNLAKHGVHREDVTKVLLSHLHFDHTGGCLFRLGDQCVPTFPNALYYAQKGEANATFKGRSQSFKDELIATLEASGQLVWLDGDGEIDDHISYQITGGHTEFHQAYWLHDGSGRSILFGGDVLPQPSQVNRKFLAKYDFDPQQSQIQRISLAKEAYQKGALLLFYHSTQEAAGFLVDYQERTGYKMELVAL